MKGKRPKSPPEVKRSPDIAARQGDDPAAAGGDASFPVAGPPNTRMS
jgi:hypothetical protein